MQYAFTRVKLFFGSSIKKFKELVVANKKAIMIAIGRIVLFLCKLLIEKFFDDMF